MTADIVNLRTARKRKARADKERRATENRATFGRSKAEKAATRGEGERASRALDALKREEPDGGAS